MPGCPPVCLDKNGRNKSVTGFAGQIYRDAGVWKLFSDCQHAAQPHWLPQCKQPSWRATGPPHMGHLRA